MKSSDKFRRELAAVSLFAAGALLFFLAGQAIYWIGLKGVVADELASYVASRKLKMRVRLYGVNFQRLSDLRFQMLVVAGRDHKTYLTTGKGRAVFLPLSYAWLEDVSLMEDLIGKSKILSWAAKNAFKDPILLKSVKLCFLEKGGRITFHILETQSPDVLIRGGLVVADRRLLAANVWLFFPEGHFENVPKEIRARMIRRSDRWRGVGITYRNRILTVRGRGGPFFQASFR